MKLFTFELIAVLTIGITTFFAFAEASEERSDAYAQWDPSSKFTTTGVAIAQVIDHYMNMNPNIVETLTVDVYTEKNEVNPELTITLTESDINTGIFSAVIYFSETKPSSGNTLQVVDGDIVSVEYTYSQVPDSDKHEDKIGVGQEKTISNSPELSVTGSTASLNTERPDAYPEWGVDVYSSTDNAIARVVDPFMNADSNKIETLTARIVVADNYDDGIQIILTETGTNTGIFEQNILFTETEDSSGNRIRVADGDDVSLDYLYVEVLGSDKREDMVEIGDEITIHNSQDTNSISDTYGFGATVHLDKEVYSWTDKIYITVTSPFHNFDSKTVEEIGATQSYTIRMHTSSSNIDNYRLVETGPDTGIFTGEIIFTGFLHDADGSGRYSHLPYEDITPMTSGTGVVRIIDPDMNWDPETIDNFFVDVWSDSDAAGIDLTVTETNENTGIFEGTVFFTTTDDSSGHKLRVVEGDTITTEYEDNTSPIPHTPKDELDITDTAIIRNIGIASPYKQIQNGVIAEHVTCNGALEKVYKSNGHPTCVKSSSVEKLMQRGWTDNFVNAISATNSQKQFLQSESYSYEELCGFPVTEQMHLKAIYDNSHRFTREGISYFELYPGDFTHSTLAENYLPNNPHLNYWFDLENGKQVYFRIEVCDVDGFDITRFEVRR